MVVRIAGVVDCCLNLEWPARRRLGGEVVSEIPTPVSPSSARNAGCEFQSHMSKARIYMCTNMELQETAVSNPQSRGTYTTTSKKLYHPGRTRVKFKSYTLRICHTNNRISAFLPQVLWSWQLLIYNTMSRNAIQAFLRETRQIY